MGKRSGVEVILEQSTNQSAELRSNRSGVDWLIVQLLPLPRPFCPFPGPSVRLNLSLTVVFQYYANSTLSRVLTVVSRGSYKKYHSLKGPGLGQHSGRHRNGGMRQSVYFGSPSTWSINRLTHGFLFDGRCLIV